LAANLKIIGIDPGLRATGFGIIEVKGYVMSYLASGVIRTQTGQLATRLATIFNSIQELISEYEPSAAAIEKVFVNVNPQSTLLLGQARGAALCALVTCELPIAEYTALQLKQAVAGYGKARKYQVQEMVQKLLSLKAKPKSDAADALGVAICHAQSKNATQILQQADARTSLQNARIKNGRLII
jgi:crossover junction endodeoxyribonuclease RuvC